MSGQVTDNKTTGQETPWLTVEEVADYLSVSAGTVRNWVSQQDIPHAKRGRVVRFHRDRIDAWLSRGACKGRTSPTPPIRRSTE